MLRLPKDNCNLTGEEICPATDRDSNPLQEPGLGLRLGPGGFFSWRMAWVAVSV